MRRKRKRLGYTCSLCGERERKKERESERERERVRERERGYIYTVR